MKPKFLAVLVCLAMAMTPILGMAGEMPDETAGAPEVALSRVAPNTDGTRADTGTNSPNGICYVWEQAEAFSPGVSVSTAGTNTKGIATDIPGTWAYNSLYTQCSMDAGSIWDVWMSGERAVMIYEVFNDKSTTGRNYTMIYEEDSMDGDGSTNFGVNNAQNTLTPINDPYMISYDGLTLVIGIAPQTTGFEVPTLFDGYGVWKSTTGPITQSNQGTFLGDAALDAGVWKCTDTDVTMDSWYAVRVKWNGGTYPFYAPRYSYGMSNDLYVSYFGHYPSYATGPVGTSNSTGLTITFEANCACFGDMYLYYSKDRNVTWNFIALVPWTDWGTMYYPWTAPGSGEYWWYSADDYLGDHPASGTPAEAGPYVINAPPQPGFGIPVVAGWNLVSFPVTATGSPQTVLNDAGGDTVWSVVKWYNPQTPSDPWKTYRIGGTANDLPGVTNMMGLWMYITNPGSDGKLVVEGEFPGNTSINLHAGWNLVGYPSLAPDTVSNALWGTGADRVEVCDLGAPGLISPVGPTYVMDAGEGYWVHVNSDAVWTVDYHKTPILLVDDDNHANDMSNEDTVTFMRAALASAGFDYDFVIVASGASGPGYDYGTHPLQYYDTIIWMTGYEQNNTLTIGSGPMENRTDDVANLRKFLTGTPLGTPIEGLNGGSLWLISEGFWTEALDPTVGPMLTDFANDYLHINTIPMFTADLPSLYGNDTHPVTDWFFASPLAVTERVPGSPDPRYWQYDDILNKTAVAFTDITHACVYALSYDSDEEPADITLDSRMLVQSWDFSRIDDTGSQAMYAYKALLWL